MDIYDNLLKAVREEYDTVRLIKKSERGEVSLIRHRDSGTRFIFRHFYGSSYLDRKKVFKYMRKNKDIMRWINNSFTIYLQQICYSFFNGIKKLVVGDIRVHIRMLNIIEDSYYEVCMAGDVLDHHVEKLKWGQLIEKAYLSKTPLIASANKMWCKASFENNENKEEDKVESSSDNKSDDAEKETDKSENAASSVEKI